MTLYSPAVRRAELCRLKVQDIDSQRMMIRINQGKGGRDREVPLSPKLLETLRVYFRWMRPTTFLFPGTVKGVRADVPITPNVVWLACRQAAQSAGITKRLSPHSLRQASSYYTTFQTSFILQTTSPGQLQSSAFYRRSGLLRPEPAQLAIVDPFDR